MTRHTEYFLLKVKIRDYNVMIDGQNFFHQPVKNYRRTYDNIQEIASCLLDYRYFKKCYKIVIDLIETQALDADPKAIQQINFTRNLERHGNTTIFFIIEDVKKLFWIFQKEP